MEAREMECAVIVKRKREMCNCGCVLFHPIVPLFIEEEPDGMSVHSPCNAPPSSASSLPKGQSEIELELRLLEALEFYPLTKLQGIHRHFVLYGLMDFLQRRFDRYFSSYEVLQLLDRFYNLEMLKPDDDEMEILNHEEDFCLPPSFFVKEEP